jgi:hypothetical protein
MVHSEEYIKKYCNHHNKKCKWTKKGTVCIQRRKEYKEELKSKIKIPKEKECKICERVLPASSFNKDNTVYCGLKSGCKTCVRERDYARISSWKGYVRKKIVASWSAHGNEEKINKLTVDEALDLLDKQKYRCNHCRHRLECVMGTQKKKNYNCASLDRIDTDVVGYGNGNAQWLCMTCNNGKNTMSDTIHKERYDYLNRIVKLEEEVKYLHEQLEILLKDKDAVQRLNGSGSSKKKRSKKKA